MNNNQNWTAPHSQLNLKTKTMNLKIARHITIYVKKKSVFVNEKRAN